MERFTTKTASLKATKARFYETYSKSLDSENIKLRGQNLEDIFGKKYKFDDGKDEVKPYEIVGNIVKVDDEKNEIFIGSQYVPDSSRYAYENREHFNFERDENGNPIRNENCIGGIEIDKAYSYNENEDIVDTFRLELSKVKNASSFTIFESGEDGIIHENKSSVYEIYYDFKNIMMSEEIPPPFELYTTFSYIIYDEMDNLDYFDMSKFIEYVDCDLNNIVNGTFMFANMMVENIKPIQIYGDLSNLQYGDGMFQYRNIEVFEVMSLESLCMAVGMFSNVRGLNKFIINCPNLYTGDFMFEMNTDLEEFTSDLSSLMSGNNMFTGCSSLKKFYSAVPNLVDGEDMFSGCILDDKSLYIIATSLPYITEIDTYGRNITLGLGCTQEELESFVTRKYFSSVEELEQMFEEKGWNVQVQYNGTSASTYGLRRIESASTPKVYVKKTEVIIDKSNRNKKNHQKIYNYRDAEGKKYYVSWCHSTKNVDDYTEFNSLEEAIETWNLTKVEFKTIKK